VLNVLGLLPGGSKALGTIKAEFGQRPVSARITAEPHTPCTRNPRDVGAASPSGQPQAAVRTQWRPVTII
jgi:hypothetical protein